MINVFAVFASEDGKQMLSHLYVTIFQFYAEKWPKDTEDVGVGKLSGSAPLHPVRCPACIHVEIILLRPHGYDTRHPPPHPL